MREKERERERL